MTRTIALSASLVALLVGVIPIPLHAQSALDGFNPGADRFVYALETQPDGKILVGGDFTRLGGGGTGTTPRGRIGRLLPDGSLDAAFDPGANLSVQALAVQPDGKILVGGDFTTLGGGGSGMTPRSYLGRLHPDGSIDATFNPGANAPVLTIAVQPDGKILVGGWFTTLGGGGTGTTPRNRIGRLHPDGSIDASFNPGADAPIQRLAVQPDARILVGGWFATLGGGGTGATPRHRIGRLHPDGSLDTTFDPGASGTVWALALQPDGKILVGGDFTRLGGGGTGATTRSRIGRLNRDGSVDVDFDPGADGIVNALALQPDGKILAGGEFVALGGAPGTTPFIGRLHPDGSLDADFRAAANSTVRALTVQLDGKVLVGGLFWRLGVNEQRQFIGRLYADGTVDADFNPGAFVGGIPPGGLPGLFTGVWALAVQSDGKVLVGGTFTTLGGGGIGTTPRNYLGRLSPDGSLDAGFDPGADGGVTAMAVQPDGKILVAGTFTMLGGGGTGTTPRRGIGRLHADGSLDTSFDPGANAGVSALAVQPDGKILVAGWFTTLGGGGTGTTARAHIGRLHADGSLDTSFDPGANDSVAVVALQPDGKILVGGGFTTLGGGGPGTTPRSRIGRLNPDGSLDTSFDPGANDNVAVVAVQPDGKILVGGWFRTLGGGGTGTTPRNAIGRLHADGSLDTSFDPGANVVVFALAVQPDRKIVVGGAFSTLGGGGTGTTPRSNIGRLHHDGAVDTTFDPGADRWVNALAVQVDGKILVGGGFTTLGGGGTGMSARTFIGRLTTTDAAIQRLGVSCPGCLSSAIQSQLMWARSGAGPEIQRVTFEASGDGMTYGLAGSASRVAGGWQVTGVSLPPNQNYFVRARGYYATAQNNASGSVVESIRQVYLACPTIAPTSLPAGTAGLSYTATLTAPGALGVVSFGVTGALPAGLMLSSTGTLSGTPTQAGTFLLTVHATDQSSGCSGSQAVTLPISPTAPLLTLDKTSLRFGAVTTGAAFVSQTAAQIVRLTQSGAGTVTWTATASEPWLQVTPASGSGSADLSISVVSVPGLPVGSSVGGAITLTATGVSNAPGPVSVSLDLLLNGLSASPFGSVDTPLENTTGVTGAVPFTGWALDDVEIMRVMVCRAAVPGEAAPVDPNCGGAAQFFLGFAVFIDGARPDVAGYAATYPANTRAGWGFMVLTNMLPSQGNGTFQFSMYAQDRDGHTSLLGTRTMTCANASATKPFGAIDTPAQGGVASGGSYAVFGWVLSRLARADPPGGGTVTVQVNGVTVGSPGGWAARPDLSALFPAYPGIDTALGVYSLNTLAYANGAHTIQWTVTDNLGVTEGIGSRYFTVSNGAASVLAASAATLAVADAEVIAQAPLDGAAIAGRRGWDLSSVVETFTAGASGRVVVRSEEVNRVELALGEQAGARYTGHLRTGDGLAPLPIGSHLDPTTGVFTWAPGVGFVGAYDFVFVRWTGAQPVSRQEVRIILAAKGSGAVGPQVVIDAPRSQQDVAQPFVLGGWAADLRATEGTGIATVHAWAYPLAGGPPVFLGATAYGGARPDVAAVHGDEFRDSGFGLVVQGLPHGHYDLAVFAWSTEIADFVPAQVVRVTVR